MGRRVLLPMVVAIAIAGAWLWTRRGGDAIEVQIAQVERVASLQSLVTASGEIVAARYADIGSDVMGRLVALHVKEGDRVRAGQVLARIDAVQAASGVDAAAAALSALGADARGAATQERAAAATLDEARARGAEAAGALARARQLRDNGLLPAAEFDKAEAAAASAQAQVAAADAAVDRARQARAASDRRVAQGQAEVDRARNQLHKTSITAPIDGVVTRLDVEEGEMVVIGVQNQPGTTLMTISDLGTINAEVKVAEADVMRLATGQPAAITLEALPGQRFTGRVVEIGASALPSPGPQAAAREFRVTVQLDQPNVALRPGLTCDAEIVTATRAGVIAVPLQAVVERSGRTGVFTLDDGTARFSAVETGIIGGLLIAVDGLSEGDEIVTGPVQALRELKDGTAIRRSR